MIAHRLAQPQDHGDIMALIAHARAAIAALGIDQWQDGYPEPEVIRSDIEQGIGIVFEVDGRIAGYIVALADPEPIYNQLDEQWLQNDAPYLTVHRMAIDDGYRGTGLSMHMFAHAEDLARRQNLASVRADTHTGNLAMRGLLKKRGYTYCGDVLYDVTAGDPVRVAYEKIME